MSAIPPPDYTVNEKGERVVAASRRPDGTIRKERRVREGYVPMEERQVYVSRGAAFRQNVPKCPGFEDTAEPAKPKSKSAAKNAKRKEKRLAEQATECMQGLSLGGGNGSAAAAAPAAAAAAAAPTAAAAQPTAAAAEQEEAPSVEKQIRNLKKKMRQAEALAEKQAAGQQLSPEEMAKLSKLAAWQEELRQLEAQL